jgi:TolB protein
MKGNVSQFVFFIPVLAAAAGCVSAKPAETIVIETTGAGRNVTRITQTPEDEIDPAVSPDGLQIAFQVISEGQSDIYSINTTTVGGRVQVTNHPSNDIEPSWLGDSKTIVFSSNRLGSYSLWKQLASGGGGCTMITRANDMMDFAPSVSATEATVCFHSRGLDSAVYSVTDAGASQYVVFRNRLPFIWKVSLSGTALTQFGKGAFPTWSPTGNMIAYCADTGGNWDIYTMKPDGTEETLLTVGAKGDQIAPSFSPDGKWMAYVSSQAGNYDLWLMKADGSQQTQLTSDPSEEGMPSWGADGNIYFCSKKAGNWDIWRLTPVLPQ